MVLYIHSTYATTKDYTHNSVVTHFAVLHRE